MAIILPTPELKSIIINTNKDWQNFSITNIKQISVNNAPSLANEVLRLSDFDSNALQLLISQKLTNVNSFDITNIPECDFLILLLLTQTYDLGASPDFLHLQFNDDTGTNYVRTNIKIDNAGNITSGGTDGQAYFCVHYCYDQNGVWNGSVMFIQGDNTSVKALLELNFCYYSANAVNSGYWKNTTDYVNKMHFELHNLSSSYYFSNVYIKLWGHKV